MRLQRVCMGISCTLLQGMDNPEIKDIVYDSRKVSEGVMFVCLTGAETDGHKYIPEAVEKGASVIVVEREEAAAGIPENVTVIKVVSSRYALALMSAAFFDYPDRKLTTIGVTGTKGKTTTTYGIRNILEKAGLKTGVIGTIGVTVGDTVISSDNTTPESYDIHKHMAWMVSEGCRYVVMEVSSQGLKLDRTAGIVFDIGVFTNLTSDHIGKREHADFDEYLQCKSKLFRQCRTGVVNIDDSHADRILEGHTCDVVTLSTEKDADVTAVDIEFLNEAGRLGMRFRTCGRISCDVKIYIPGRFSVYNALTSAAVCSCLGISEEAIVSGLESTRVKGRVEMIPVSPDFSVIIDYAHNEASTRSVLETLLQYEPKRLIAVFGCGGNRSRVRRYDIGEVAGELADLSILTSDNPRFEKVEDINNDIKIGLAKHDGKYIEIEDRKEAIAYAITHARPGDMIVMLGKGHEDYIETEGVKRHFSEHEAIMEIMQEIRDGKRRMSAG